MTFIISEADLDLSGFVFNIHLAYSTTSPAKDASPAISVYQPESLTGRIFLIPVSNCIAGPPARNVSALSATIAIALDFAAIEAIQTVIQCLLGKLMSQDFLNKNRQKRRAHPD